MEKKTSNKGLYALASAALAILGADGINKIVHSWVDEKSKTETTTVEPKQPEVKIPKQPETVVEKEVKTPEPKHLVIKAPEQETTDTKLPELKIEFKKVPPKVTTTRLPKPTSISQVKGLGRN